MKRRGQSLVEFIIILPIFLMLVLGVIDLGNIMISKMQLEENLSDAVLAYEKDKSLEEIKNDLKLSKNYELTEEKNNEYTTLKLTKSIDLITPGFHLILDNPYEIVATRSILNE